MKDKKTVFVVDDDEDDLLFLREAVNKLNISVDFYHAGNGELALRQLREETVPVPDFIFLDLNMPKLNGRECLPAIKKLPRYANIPIIIYSTSSHQKDIQEIMQYGATHFLTKPTTIGELCDKLQEIFNMDWKQKSSSQTS